MWVLKLSGVCSRFLVGYPRLIVLRHPLPMGLLADIWWTPILWRRWPLTSLHTMWAVFGLLHCVCSSWIAA